MPTLPPTALVLTAGRGTRLEPLSFVRAKPAVPVAGMPLVRRIIQWLAAFGVNDLILNLHHLPETIACVVGDGRDLGVRVRYSWEPRLLGSAGGPRRALPLFDTERCLIVNGDTLTAIDLEALAEAHARAGAAVTMALVPNPDPWRYGGVVLDEASRIVKFTPRVPSTEYRVPSTDLYHFVGVQLVERGVFSALPEGEPAETVAGLYRTLIAEGTRVVQGFTCEAPFHDIGTPSDYLQTSLTLARAEGRGDELPRGARTAVAADARVVRTALWDDVDIGAGAELVECVVADRVRVPPRTHLERTVLIARDDCAAAEVGQIIGNAVMFPIDEGAR